MKANLSYKRLCANLGESPKIADVSSSDSKGEDYDVGEIYDRENSKESLIKYVSDLTKQFLKNLNVRSVDKKDYPLSLLGGGSGMGKSFLLDVIGLKWAKECLAMEENNYIAIPITFNAKTTLLAKEHKLDAESKLCLRALYFLFGATMRFADFVALAVTQFEFPLYLEVIVAYCHRQHKKKVVVFLVDELLKITDGKDPAHIHHALSALGRVSQDYTSGTDCLVLGIASSLVFGEIVKWSTISHRPLRWCRLPLFARSTMLQILKNHRLGQHRNFQRLMSYCNGLPKAISELLRLTSNAQGSEMKFDEFEYILDSLVNLANCPPEFEQLLMYSIINKNAFAISEDDIIPNTNNWRIEEAILRGCCYLDSAQGHLHINMLMVRQFRNKLQKGTTLHDILGLIFDAGDNIPARDVIARVDFERLTINYELLTRYAFAYSGVTEVTLQQLFPLEAWFSEDKHSDLKLKVFSLSTTSTKFFCKKVPFNKYISDRHRTPLPTTGSMFLRPTEENFLGLDYIQLWDAVSGAANVRSKVAFCVQNKLRHVTPTKLSDYANKMESVIKKLEKFNRKLRFIPVYITLTKTPTKNSKKEDYLKELNKIHGKRTYVYLVEEATEAFLHPFTRLLLLNRSKKFNEEESD